MLIGELRHVKWDCGNLRQTVLVYDRKLVDVEQSCSTARAASREFVTVAHMELRYHQTLTNQATIQEIA